MVVIKGDGSGICNQSKMGEAINGDDLWQDIPTRGTPMKSKLPNRYREAIGYS